MLRIRLTKRRRRNCRKSTSWKRAQHRRQFPLAHLIQHFAFFQHQNNTRGKGSAKITLELLKKIVEANLRRISHSHHALPADIESVTQDPKITSSSLPDAHLVKRLLR